MQEPLSIFIICKNEENIIEKCLIQARKLADEIIVVDSGSTDRTLEIVHKYADQLVHHDWEGFSQQKNYALGLCKNEWVLNLDADEVLSDELIKEIQGLDFSESQLAIGFKIARRLFIGDKFIRYCGFYPDYQLRLFNKRYGQFKERGVHESVQLISPDGQVLSQHRNSDQTLSPKLKNPYNHYSYESLAQMQDYFMRYAELGRAQTPEAEKSNLRALFSALFTFIKKYFVRLGFLHGLLGLQLAWMQAKYSYRKWCH